MLNDLQLRAIEEDDLPILFEHQLDPEALRLAAFSSRDWDAYIEHWTKVLANQAIIKRSILLDGQVAGCVSCFERRGKIEVGYWIDRRYWGMGVATKALREFLEDEATPRPLYAYVAKHNAPSIRVLEKCGFAHVGEVAEFSRIDHKPVAGLILKLKAPE